MGQRYRQFSVDERCEIARLRGACTSLRQIAAALDRAPSSVARELKRNSGAQVGYRPAYAQVQARARRWSGSKLDRDAELREQVARRSRLTGGLSVGVETIYRFIYAQIARHNDFSWRRYLPRSRFKRGWRASKGGSPALHMTARVPLSQRPAEAADRLTLGHWEADLMAFAAYGQNILMLHERTSRALIGSRLASKQAEPVARAIGAALATLPPALRRTITFDNGTEFARHYELGAIGIAAIRMRHGRRAASRTPSVACVASCRARPTWQASIRTASTPSSRPTTTPRANALTGTPRQKPSITSCCTSNENPQPGFRRDDGRWEDIRS